MSPRHVSLKLSMFLVQVSVIVTWLNFALPIFSVFYQVEIGMSLAQIGQSQAAYTVAVLLVNAPTAWAADRYSRKVCNVIGCLVAASGFVIYASADSFLMVVVAEAVSGIGLATAEGADAGLLESIATKLNKAFDDVNRQTTNWRIGIEIAVVGIGGYVGVAHPRTTMLMTAGVLLVGGIASTVAEDPAKYPRHRQPLIGFKFTAWIRMIPAHVKSTRQLATANKQLVWWVIAWGVTQRIPQAVVWFFTPLLLIIGASATVVGASWVIFMVAVLVGSLAAKFSCRLSESSRYGICIVLVGIAAGSLSLGVNAFSVTLYACFGLLRGWQTAVIPPIVLRHAPCHAKSMSIGMAGLVGDSLYIPAVAAIGAASDIDLQWGMLVAFGYVPLMLLTWYKLRQ